MADSGSVDFDALAAARATFAAAKTTPSGSSSATSNLASIDMGIEALIGYQPRNIQQLIEASKDIATIVNTKNPANDKHKAIAGKLLEAVGLFGGDEIKAEIATRPPNKIGFNMFQKLFTGSKDIAMLLRELKRRSDSERDLTMQRDVFVKERNSAMTAAAEARDTAARAAADAANAAAAARATLTAAQGKIANAKQELENLTKSSGGTDDSSISSTANTNLDALISAVKRKLEQAQSEAEAAKAKVAEATVREAAAQADLATARAQAEAQAQAQAQAEAQAAREVAEREAAEAQVAAANQRVEEANQRVEEANQQVAAANQRVVEADQRVAAARANPGVAVATAEAQAARATAEQRAHNLEQSLKQAQQAQEQAETKLASAEETFHNILHKQLEAAIENHQTSIDMLHDNTNNKNIDAIVENRIRTAAGQIELQANKIVTEYETRNKALRNALKNCLAELRRCRQAPPVAERAEAPAEAPAEPAAPAVNAVNAVNAAPAEPAAQAAANVAAPAANAAQAAPAAANVANAANAAEQVAAAPAAAANAQPPAPPAPPAATVNNNDTQPPEIDPNIAKQSNMDAERFLANTAAAANVKQGAIAAATSRKAARVSETAQYAREARVSETARANAREALKKLPNPLNPTTQRDDTQILDTIEHLTTLYENAKIKYKLINVGDPAVARAYKRAFDKWNKVKSSPQLYSQGDAYVLEQEAINLQTAFDTGNATLLKPTQYSGNARNYVDNLRGELDAYRAKLAKTATTGGRRFTLKRRKSRKNSTRKH